MTQNLQLRPFQIQALETLTKNPEAHLVCQSHTGSGKSMIFQRFLAQNPVRTVIICPLIALAEQHRAALEALYFPTRFKDSRSLAESMVWILSPESLNGPLLDQLKKWSPQFLVVDECHCIYEWGDSFRPDFSKIPKLAHDLGVTHSLWLSATLLPSVLAEMKRTLPKPLYFQGKFSVPGNLNLVSLPISLENRLDSLRTLAESRDDPGIIFVNTKAMAQRLQGLLSGVGLESSFFHSSLSSEEKYNRLRIYQSEQPGIVIATSAFGMGMDFKQFSWVALAQVPFSILDLAQKIGRVGRANKKGTAFLFWDLVDFELLKWSMTPSSNRAEQVFELKRFFLSLGGKEKLGAQSPSTLLEEFLNLPDEIK
jgi:ATP-dependent DNA helicase RecQ